MATTKVHSYFPTVAAAEAGAQFPGAVMDVWEYFDRDPDRSAENISGAVPATSPYVVKLPARVPQQPVTVTVGGNARTVIAGGSPGAGQVGYDRVTGLLTFHSSDASGAFVANIKPLVTAILAGDMHRLQAELAAAQTALGDQITAEDFLDAHPNTLYVSTGGDDTDGNGSFAAPYATFGKAVEIINASAETDWVVRLGVGEFAFAFSGPGDGSATLAFSAGKVVHIIGSGRSLTTLDVGFEKSSGEGTGSGRFNFRGLARLSLDSTPVSPAVLFVGSPANTDALIVQDVAVTGEPMRVADGSLLFNSSVDKITTGGGTGAGTVLSSVSGDNLQVGANGTAYACVATTLLLAGYVYDSVVGNLQGARVARGVRLTGTFSFDQTFTGKVTASDLNFQRSNGGVTVGLFNINNASASEIVIEKVSMSYTGVYDEGANDGIVMFLSRRNYAGQVTVRDCVFDGSINSILNSHPINDPGRNTKDQPLRMERCTFRMIRNNEVGPADTNAPILIYSRGNVEIIDCIIETDTTAVTDSTDGRSGCVYVSSSHTAGTSNVVIKGGRMSLLTAGAGVYAEGRAPVLNAGSGGTTNITIDDVRIERDGNSSGTIDNGATPTVTLGALSLDATLVTTNSVTRAGSFNANDGAFAGDVDIAGVLRAGVPIAAKTSTYAIAAGESGATFTNEGASGAVDIHVENMLVGEQVRIARVANHALNVFDSGFAVTFWAPDKGSTDVLELLKVGAYVEILRISASQILVTGYSPESGAVTFTVI